MAEVEPRIRSPFPANLTIMPLGLGFFFDRRRRRYIRIVEHASDVLTRPRRFRSQAVAHLDPVSDREAIVRHAAAAGFIRVRLWKDRLGWEFDGAVEDSIATLKRFIVRRGVGPVVQVHIADFATGTSISLSAAVVTRASTAGELGFSSAPSCLVECADIFADEAAAEFRDHNRPFVNRLDHARRVQARLLAKGVTDEIVLAAARLSPLCPAGQLSAPLLAVSMVLGDMMADTAREAVASLADEVAMQLVCPPHRRRRLSTNVRIILAADSWCRKHAA